MSFFRRPDYVSEASQFIQQLKSNQPELPQKQLKGRALLWQRHVQDREVLEGFAQARVPQKPYVYQTKS